MKKFLTALLAVMIIMALAVPAFAAETGSITVKNTVAGQEYSVYKMAVLNDYDAAKGAYLYTPETAWKGFFDLYVKDNTAGNPVYFEYNTAGNVIVADGAAVDAAEFAMAALAYADANNISITGEAQTAAADGEELVFNGLALGYYLVDSSLGAFCGLTTTDPDAEVEEKNAKPEISKLVEEDSTRAWGTVNDADLFQTVNYKTTVTVQTGAMNYVIHDKMEAGLTWAGSVAVSVGGVAVEAGDGTYTLVSDPTDGCTFEIVFADSYVQGLAAGTDIVVEYSASLNESAEIYTGTSDNETWLAYGDASETTHVVTQTKTYKFSFVKTDADGKVLDGAKFKLYNALTGGEEIKVVKVSDGIYRLAKSTETGVEIETVNGVATVQGLDGNNTKYYIEETAAPAGYNMLTAREEVELVDSNYDATVTDGVYASGIQIINRTGSELPSTGGEGTVLFIVIGGIVVLGAGVLLFARKRMSQIAE